MNAALSVDRIEHGRLAVETPHLLAWWRSGRRGAKSILFLHGGPGARSSPDARSLCDPRLWDIVQFDQRGCGESMPLGAIEGNDTGRLIADIEALRSHLDIEQWFLFGHSWGSALALAYAQNVPERCRGLILSAISLGERYDACWFFEGPRVIFPQQWEKLMAVLDADERAEPAAAYSRRLRSPATAVRTEAALALTAYDRWLLNFMPDLHRPSAATNEEKAIAYATIFTHYLANDYFLGDGRLIAGLDRIRSVPAEIVQGRYDVGSSFLPAHRLHTAWPEARFTIVADGAHSAREQGMKAAISSAICRIGR